MSRLSLACGTVQDGRRTSSFRPGRRSRENEPARSSEKSFALVVGYKSAHGPFQPPPRLENRYEGKEARPTPNIDVPAIYADKFSAGKTKAEAEAKGAKLLVDALGSPQAYNNYIFAKNFEPQELRLIFAGPGTFWTDLKNFQEIGASKMIQQTQEKK